MSEDEDPATAALRLEDALDRIAQIAARGIIGAAAKAPRPGGEPEARTEAIDRLDALIANLRAALAGSPGEG